jgi:hypothetical protein
MRYCRRCGKALPAHGEAYCPSCGEPVTLGGDTAPVLPGSRAEPGKELPQQPAARRWAVWATVCFLILAAAGTGGYFLGRGGGKPSDTVLTAQLVGTWDEKNPPEQFGDPLINQTTWVFLADAQCVRHESSHDFAGQYRVENGVLKHFDVKTYFDYGTPEEVLLPDDYELYKYEIKFDDNGNALLMRFLAPNERTDSGWTTYRRRME